MMKWKLFGKFYLIFVLKIILQQVYTEPFSFLISTIVFIMQLW